MMMSRLFLAICLVLVQGKPNKKPFPASYSRVGEYCPDPDNEHKRFVCHINGNGGVKKLDVGAPAVSAHLGHGDALPGGYGPDGVRYDCDCNPEYPPDMPCTDDECCHAHPLVNQDPTLGNHFDANCPTKVGDPSLVGCVEFTGCRYRVVQCDDDICCQQNPLRNPDLPVVFDPQCPARDGDPSVVGCIEFTLCRYTDGGDDDGGQCFDDVCCVNNPEVNPISFLGIHFDPDCPHQDGEPSEVGCVGFTGCRYGSDFENPCSGDDCCKANPIVNQDAELDAHFDDNCPIDVGQPSLVGCVEFTGCRYETSVCDDDACCAHNSLVNQEIGAHFDAACPTEKGDISELGCIEFTGCRYNSVDGRCFDDACCASNPLVSQDPSLGAHFESGCPTKVGDHSLVGCVEFTGCSYYSTVCDDDGCCLANPLIQPDDDLGAHFDSSCPVHVGDDVQLGCVDFTSCRYADKSFLVARDLARNGSGGLSGGAIAAIILCLLLALAAGAGFYYYYYYKPKKTQKSYVAMAQEKLAAQT